MYLKDLENYKCPIIITQYIDNIDKAIAILSLYKVLVGLNKKVDLVIINNPDKDIVKILKEYNIKYLSSVKPLLYEVWVDYGRTSIKSISYDMDEKNKKLKFIITPGDDGFDFNSIEFKDGGTGYDLTILFDVPNPEDLSDIYEYNDYIFRENKVISIGVEHNHLYENSLDVVNGNYCYAVYKLLEKSRIDISPEITQLLIGNTINNIDILNDYLDPQTWSVISSLSKTGIDINSLIRKKYFSKSEENLNLSIKLMQNVKMNRKLKYIWSYVNSEDMKYFRVDKNNLDISGRLPYNVAQGYDFAIAIYELAPNQMMLLIESNNTDRLTAYSIASVFSSDCDGNDYKATCTIKNQKIDDMEKKIETIIQELDQLNNK